MWSVNWLVQMIIKAASAMKEFLFILIIVIFAFGSAYSAHSNYMEVDYNCKKMNDADPPVEDPAGEWVCD
jgi:hypothetical protein